MLYGVTTFFYVSKSRCMELEDRFHLRVSQYHGRPRQALVYNLENLSDFKESHDLGHPTCSRLKLGSPQI